MLNKVYRHKPRVLQGYKVFPYYLKKDKTKILTREERISNIMVSINRSMFYSRGFENYGYFVIGLFNRYQLMIFKLNDKDFNQLLVLIEPNRQYLICSIKVFKYFQKLKKRYAKYVK
jgi:hypothetical protein